MIFASFSIRPDWLKHCLSLSLRARVFRLAVPVELPANTVVRVGTTLSRRNTTVSDCTDLVLPGAYTLPGCVA